MAVESHDKNLETLLGWVEDGTAQLPEFQRSWVWSDTQICKLIESITSGYPMGAAMFLAYGGTSIRFKYRTFEGVSEDVKKTPDWLVLDGQQRLTTLFQVFKSKKPVSTKLETNKERLIKRYYYLDMKKCLDEKADRLDAIISISEKKIQTSEIGRKVELDLTTTEKEYDNLMFPLNIVFSQSDLLDWFFGITPYYNNDSAIYQLSKDFQTKVIKPILNYKMPVIELDKEMPKEAVCQIFENVNTGGSPLTVFELITASFAADDFNLRKDWETIKNGFADKKLDVLKDITGTNFLSAMTLLTTYKRSLSGDGAVSCKKKDILRLELKDYQANHDGLVQGFLDAARFLVHEGIYRSEDVPYTTQIVPLAAIFAFDYETDKVFKLNQNLEKLRKWYWCGVFGELYGSANEARFALDIANIFEWVGGGNTPDTFNRAMFQPTRLLSMQTRNSAAYKGVMALIMQDSPLDFMTGNKMDVASYIDEDTDIHHIFPQAHCVSKKYPSKKWNSVINKTPIYASTNRSIGGRAPSEYVKTMFNKGLSQEKVIEAIESHKISSALLMSDNFDEYFIDRTIRLLDRIECAMGKEITGRDSEETMKEYGCSLPQSHNSFPVVSTKQKEEDNLIITEDEVFSTGETGELENRVWLLPSNEKKFSLIDVMEVQDYVEWYYSVNLRVGDTIYMYSSDPIRAIIARYVVDALDIEKQNIDEENAPSYVKEKQARFVNLEIPKDIEKLSYVNLAQHGLKGRVQGPRTISGELLEYIEKVF